MNEHGRGWFERSASCVALLLWFPALGLAAEEAAHGEGGLISLDKSLIIQMVNFGLLLFVLWRLLYRPLVAKLEERTAAIRKSLDEAQQARLEAQRLHAENTTKLRQAYADAEAIRASALKEAGEEQRKLLEAARLEAHRIVEAGKAQVDSDVRQARHELRREVGDLATAVAERLIKRSLRDADHRRIVDEALASLGRSPS